jgi:cytochrome c oxidase subunit IV
MSEPTTHPAGHAHHLVPVSAYYWNFAALMVLLVLTLVAAMFDLGEFNTIIALTIAVAKALLVVLYFMHLRWSTALVRVFAGAALFWLTILFTLTLDDYFSRPWFGYH